VNRKSELQSNLVLNEIDGLNAGIEKRIYQLPGNTVPDILSNERFQRLSIGLTDFLNDEFVIENQESAPRDRCRSHQSSGISRKQVSRHHQHGL